MRATPTRTAFHRVGQLAALPHVHQAFQWFHLQQMQLAQWQRAIVSIPAPTFHEHQRAAWLQDRFRDIGLTEVHLDDTGNVHGTLAAAARPSATGQSLAIRPLVLISAHLDTVFPADALEEEPVEQNGRLYAPGASDNAAGLTALLAIAATLRACRATADCDLLFIGNTGEEGEGDLQGMRALFSDPILRQRVCAAIALDGAGTNHAVTEALGSRRYQVIVRGPGGHSWTDSDNPNPILVLSRAIAALAESQIPNSPRTTWNVGLISGGTSINSIPESATARIDTRSTDADQLVRLEVLLHRAVEDAVVATNTARGLDAARITSSIDMIGDRPSGMLRENSPLMEAIRAVDRHLNIRTELRVASTDANIPLSLGIDAVTIGGGGTAGGMHTRGEWFSAAGRELALKRILLLVLLCACQAAGE